MRGETGTAGSVNPQGVGAASLHTGRTSGRPYDRSAWHRKSSTRGCIRTPFPTNGTGTTVTEDMAMGRSVKSLAPTITVSARRYHFALADSGPATELGYLSTPSDASRIARAVIGSEISECVIAIMLDARHRVMGYAEVCRGTLNATRFAARDVLVPALLANAAGVIIAHNHPSGDPTPSRADRAVTDVLRSACELVGIAFVDHLVVTASGHYSFNDEPAFAAGSPAVAK